MPASKTASNSTFFHSIGQYLKKSLPNLFARIEKLLQNHAYLDGFIPYIKEKVTMKIVNQDAEFTSNLITHTDIQKKYQKMSFSELHKIRHHYSPLNNIEKDEWKLQITKPHAAIRCYIFTVDINEIHQYAITIHQIVHASQKYATPKKK
eukprot:50227_1